MFKNARLTKAVCGLTMCSIPLSFAPTPVRAANLAPVSFTQMYGLAQNGNVSALRASVRRGLNIDVMDANGDTGLCIAAKRRDAYTYNSFRAAGANPRHPCTTNISHYQDFVNSSDVVPVTSTSREALGTIGKENYSLSSTTWWILGGLVVAGVVAGVALGGGGGGGSSSGSESDNSQEDYNSMASKLGVNNVATKSTASESTNKERLVVSNDNITEITQVNLLKSVLDNTEYLNAVLKAHDGGVYTNNATMSISSGVIGMAAVDKSEVINSGYINAGAYNASIGMVASNVSQAINTGKGIYDGSGTNGIYLNFSGYSSDGAVVGMYADTQSIIINEGDIVGTATTAATNPNSSSGDTSTSTDDSDTSADDSADSGTSNTSSSATTGTIVGMEAMIINVGADRNNEYIELKNDGNIKISAGDGSTGTEIKVSTIGMGSYLDDDFLNGSLNIKRGEKVTLENNGLINLEYTGQYSSDDDTLRKGLGGVVGMRADANTTATNNGEIVINLTDDGSSSSVKLAAAMQSVHSGILENSKNGVITIKTEAQNKRITYAMLSVEGSGTVAGLYTNNQQTVTNNGTINLSASYGFGLATYNSGKLVNYGTINIGSESDSYYNKSIAIYASSDAKQATITNAGTINIYAHDSAALENDYSGATTLINAGKVTIYKSATGSHVFSGNYTDAINNGTVDYYVTYTETGGGESSSDGDTVITVAEIAISTQGALVDGDANSESSGSGNVTNNGTINLHESSYTAAMGVETKQSIVTNKGIINIYDNESDTGKNTLNSVGMYISDQAVNNARIVNYGTININPDYSAAMVSKSATTATVTNMADGVLNVNGAYSYGIYSVGGSYIYNKGYINLSGKENIGIYVNGTGEIGQSITVENTGTIYAEGKNATAIKVKGSALITELGTINTSDDTEVKETMTYVYTLGSLTLDTDFTIDGGTLVKTGEGGDTTNKATLTLDGSKGKIITVVDGGSVTNYGSGVLNVLSDSSYGMSVDDENGGTLKNAGSINLGTSSSAVRGGYGMYAGNSATAENSGEITGYGTGGYALYGIYAGEGATVSNIGSITLTGSSSYGIYSVSGTVTNSGSINVTGSNSYGIFALSGTVTNSGSISVSGSGSYGIYAGGDATATNNGTISASDGATKYNDNVTDNSQTSSTTTTSYLLRSVAGGNIINNGSITGSGNMDFDVYTEGNGIISIGKGGSYTADSFSGTVVANSNIVTQGFAEVYSNENSFIGEDNGLNIVSGSYMFTADKLINDGGNIDVVMNRKSFSELVTDTNMARFLEDNYKEQKGETVFNVLKTASTASGFAAGLRKITGNDFVPDLIKQRLDAERTVNRKMNEDILQYTEEQNRAVVKAFAYKQDVDAKSGVIGYKDREKAVYGFTDTKMGSAVRGGFGLAAVRSDVKFDDTATAYNNMLEVYVPVVWQKNTAALMLKPKAGLGRGHYRRIGADAVYKADTKEYYYGADTNAELVLDTALAEVVPNIGLNMTGVAFDDVAESGNGLRLDDKNIISWQSVVGLDLRKQLEFAENNVLALKVGGKYYHEFGDKYRTKATVGDMIGNYEITDGRLQRNFGLLDLGAEYKYNNILLNMSVNMPLAQKSNPYYMLGLGYKF